MDFNPMSYAARPGEGGSLNFEEDINDIPSGLVFDEHPRQQQPHPSHAQHYLPQQQGTHHQQFQPSPYGRQPSYPQFAPPPPPSHAAQSAVLPPLTSQVDDAPLVKRPRGRPRKVPGTESRGGTAAAPASRGRPRGSRARGRGRGGRGRGRGGKRGRASSDDEEEDTNDSDSDDGNGSSRTVNLGEEMPDDFNSTGDNTAAPTTKFGRKISKPKTFIPTNRPTIHRKKRTLHNPDAHLMCQVCREGHSQPVNKLVICDSCAKGWHQLCHQPNVQEQVVASDLSWLCKACDVKLALSRPAVDVTLGDWASVDSYTREEKKEWLEGLPLHSLVNYVLSIEKKYAPQLHASALAIWPPSLPDVLNATRTRRAAEAEERRLKEEAEENPGLATESEAGTPSSFDVAPDAPLARTAASVRAAAAAAASNLSSTPQDDKPPSPQHPTTQQQERPVLPPLASRPGAPFLRQTFAPVPALQHHQQQQPQHHQQQTYQHRPGNVSSSPWSTGQPSPYPSSSQSYHPSTSSQSQMHASQPYGQQYSAAPSYPNFVNNQSPLYPNHSQEGSANQSPDPNNDADAYRLLASLEGHSGANGMSGWASRSAGQGANGGA